MPPMSRLYKDLKIGLDEDLEEHLRWLMPTYGSHRVLKKSVDARRRHEAHFIYSVEVFEQNEKPTEMDFPMESVDWRGKPPLVVGAGPAGLFAALRLCERGIPCVLLEQGSDAVKRMKGITRFWRYGELDPFNNVCFGEGGAGLYSDGKLITRIKSPFIPYVMHRLVEFGAPEEIKYLANPHVGSDRIRRVIPKLRQRIVDLGGEIRFDSKVVELLTTDAPKRVTGVKLQTGENLESDHVILACGHSAEDLFYHLHEKEVFMEGKSFAVGLRIEHPQEKINELQYRQHAGHPKLGSANYKLTHHNRENNIGVYSFCMCPGGYVLSSGTEIDAVVCNGMSNYNRNSKWANAAIVVSVDYQKSFGEDLFAGLKFRRDLETKAYEMVKAAGGSKELPAQRLTDFLAERPTESFEKTSSPSGVVPARLDQLIPENLKGYFIDAIEKFEHSMKGFICDEAVLFAVESRTSCPIRITRDKESLESLSHQGLYPSGEGAGYAGGITSAACDGIRIAEQIIQNENLI